MELTASNPDRGNYSVIFVSPHLDDAILSCGGTIHQLTYSGKPVLIVTVMAGNPPAGDLSPFARSLHRRWHITAEDVAIRRKEDIDACLELGAEWLHWEIPDCIYRRSTADDKELYGSEESLFGEIDPSEATLVDSLSGLMESLPQSDSLYIPLAVGHHVDHQLTRMAAENLPDGSAITYYEEYPYSISEHRLTVVLDAAAQWSSEVTRLIPEDMEARIRAIRCYQSQLSTFFADADDLSQQVKQYIGAVGGERFWKKSP